MILIWPASLLGLVLAGVVAGWALFRPSRQLAVVGSLSLWREALDALGRSAGRSRRRITASWAMLLIGAAGVIFALARPVAVRQAEGRRVSMALWPSAELGPSAEPLARAVGGLLDRLGPDDRIQLLRPTLLGGAGGWLTLDRARAELAELASLPVPADQLVVPDADPSSRQTYRFVPAGTDVPGGARATVIELPTALPAVTIEAVGAVPLDGGGGQLFVALRNRSAEPFRGELSIASSSGGPNAPVQWTRDEAPVTIPAGGRAVQVRPLSGAGCVAIEVATAAGEVTAWAYLARVAARKRKVALIGKDEPLLRRYVEADDAVQPVGSAGEADVVIANGVEPPSGAACLVIDPPSAPPGWRRDGQLSAVVLADADIAAADPVLRGVNLRAAAVRRVRPWSAVGSPSQEVLISIAERALLLRDVPQGPVGTGAPRIYVAFELSGDNTNLAMSEAFVVLLANAVRWLSPAGRAEAVYKYDTPLGAAGAAGWARLAGPADSPAPASPLPRPGIFRDRSGALRAVSLVGLSAAEPGQPVAQAVAAAPLPKPEAAGRSFELWPILAAAAVAFWLAGWALRLRGS